MKKKCPKCNKGVLLGKEERCCYVFCRYCDGDELKKTSDRCKSNSKNTPSKREIK